MALVRVSSPLLVRLLCADQEDVRITAASFDDRCDQLLLEVEGPGIPAEAEEVRVVVTETEDPADLVPRRTTTSKFEIVG